MPQASAHIASLVEYNRLYAESINQPDKFWRREAAKFHFELRGNDADEIVNFNFNVNDGPIKVEWFKGWTTNVCYNCLDRHIEKDSTAADKVAFHWVGNEPADKASITYGQLLKRVCQFANVLKANGVHKGDRVAIYMPMVVELIVAMLACARIGAIHSIVFGGFSAASLASRLADGGVSLLLTADGVWRGKKLIPLLDIANEALDMAERSHGHIVKRQIVLNHLHRVCKPENAVSCPPGTVVASEINGSPTKMAKTTSGHADSNNSGNNGNTHAKWNSDRDVFWDDACDGVATECDVVWMDAEEPLFILYTSGSTGTPKGVLHTTAGYMIYAATTARFVFDLQPDTDVYWCTADIGWITGHSYVTYGPLLNGVTSVVFEGMPFHPTADRFWSIIADHAVTKFYTAPTAIRALMRFGTEFAAKYDLSSLKVLGSVGEPINPEAWAWYNEHVGGGRCAVVDTYWQTETGGHIITPLPAIGGPRDGQFKPGAAAQPFFGVRPVVLDRTTGAVIKGEGEGYLGISQPWPGLMRTVFGDHDRFEKTYFTTFPGYYMTGDGVRRDADGYLWITGRIDDMLNCSGHLLSTAEIESVMVEHAAIAEAAVVACSHAVKGQCVYAYVTPVAGVAVTDDVKAELRAMVRTKIAPFAVPDTVQEASQLPKTRSGKIMRRVLRKIAEGDASLGDVSTMADPGVVDSLQAERSRLLAL